ncbi:S-layer homology domain-containing protein [Bacilliculturomica massiliensis]|uniref:S-layer homology domain-containing protein n=1 Tax=Bacilliculturomica massiliensis TaxID=1917867 RepID=UPI00103226BE|nr:S-layer homology domain-containing protein [Bacilliculturomica massiliensis]
MKKLWKRPVSFLLVLILLVTMNAGAVFAAPADYIIGTRARAASGIVEISDIQVHNNATDPVEDYVLVITGTAVRSKPTVRVFIYDEDYNFGSFSETCSTPDFTTSVIAPVGGKFSDGLYQVGIVDPRKLDVDQHAIIEQGYLITFEVVDNVVQPGWDVLLLESSAEITAGDVTPATTEAALNSSVTFTVGDVTTVGGVTPLAPEQPDYTLEYQWMFQEKGKTTFTTLSAMTAAALTIDTVTAGSFGSYQCVVSYTETGKSPSTATAKAAVLTAAKADPNLAVDSSVKDQEVTYNGQGQGVAPGTATTSADSITYTYATTAALAVGTESFDGPLPLTAGKYAVVAHSLETDFYKGATVGGITLTITPGAQTLTGTAGQVSIGSTLDLTTCVTGKAAGADLTFRIDDSADSTGAVLDPDGKTLKDATTTGAVTVYVSASAVTGKYNASPEISFTVNVNEGEAVTVGAVSTLGGKTYAPGGVRLGDILISPVPAVTAVNGGAPVKGQWSWSAPETTLGAVTAANQTAVFTPAPAGENNGVVYAGTTVQIPVTVDKAVPALTLTLSPAAVGYGGTAAAIAELSCSTDSSVTLTYTSADTGKATIDTDGNITAVSKGAVNITASFAGDANYQAVSSSAVFTVQAEPDAPALTLTAGDKKLTANWTRPNDNGSEITGYTLLFKYQGVVSTEPAVKYEYGSQSITTTGGIDAIGGYASGGAFYVSEGGIEHLVTTSAAIHEIQGEVTVTKTAVKTATSYTLDPATNDLEYKVSLFATNAIGDGPFSNEAKATPKAGNSGSSGGHGGGGGGGGSAVTQSYTVEFKAGAHGTLEGKASLSVEKDGKIKNAPEVKADKGYVFLGWSADGKTVIDLSQYKVTGKVTLTALYQKGSGYIEGYADGTFRPDNNMTRAEVATVLAKLSKGFDSEKSYTGDFTDVGSDWYRDFVNYAASNNIFSGYKDGSFRPDNRITRAEFAACLANFMGISGQGSSSFTDAGGHWAEGYISALKEKGITAGYADNTFRPENQITRAEVVTMLNQALNIKGSGAIAPSDVTKAHWAYEQIISAVNADIGDVLR